MSTTLVFFFLAAGVAFLDGCRRSSIEWVEADRNRAFWLTMIALLNFAGAVLYLLLVVPQFSRHQQVDGTFLKQSHSDATTIERKLR